MRNVGIRCEYVGYTRCGHGGFIWSSLSPPEAGVGGWTLPVITQLDTCRFKPPVRALRSLEMSSRASEMRFR
jgi:hypothetical protein